MKKEGFGAGKSETCRASGWQSHDRAAKFDGSSRGLKYVVNQSRPSLTVGLLTLSPQLLLQIIKSFDDFFLDQVAPLRNYGFARGDNFAHSRSGKREDNTGQEIILRRTGDRRIVQINCEEVSRSARCQRPAGRINAARTVYRGALK